MQAKASEMEHAIRWHIKINMDKDPALYTKFSERLQKILDAHKDHWDVIADELTKLRDDIGKGRGPAPSPTSPFFDLLILESGITDKQSNDYELSGKIAEVIYSKIKEFISIPNCWQKPSERKQLERSIRIERDGSLSVLVPEKTSDHEVEAILKSNEYKIHKCQAKRALLNEKAVNREPVNGQSYLYLGRNYYLQYRSEKKCKKSLFTERKTLISLSMTCKKTIPYLSHLKKTCFFSHKDFAKKPLPY